MNRHQPQLLCEMQPLHVEMALQLPLLDKAGTVDEGEFEGQTSSKLL